MTSIRWLHTKKIEAKTEEKFKGKLLAAGQGLQALLDELNFKYDDGVGWGSPPVEIIRYKSIDSDLTLTQLDDISPFDKTLGYGDVLHFFIAKGKKNKAVDEVVSRIQRYYKEKLKYTTTIAFK